MGWMCPIYKKKDRTKICNYRPIMLMNADYKWLTKVTALQMLEEINPLIHKNQSGFMPKWSIFNNIRLANVILKYAEITESNSAIVLLDQEKAYEKIWHNYLWETLECMDIPPLFINTVKELYKNTFTRVVINGKLSSPYWVTRGVRKGDPLSCALFNLAIEPLACTIRNNESLIGYQIPGLTEKQSSVYMQMIWPFI